MIQCLKKSKHTSLAATKIEKFSLYISPLKLSFSFAVELFAQLCHLKTNIPFAQTLLSKTAVLFVNETKSWRSESELNHSAITQNLETTDA